MADAVSFSLLRGFHATVRCLLFYAAFHRLKGFELFRHLYSRSFGSDDSHPRLVLAIPDREIVRGL